MNLGRFAFTDVDEEEERRGRRREGDVVGSDVDCMKRATGPRVQQQPGAIPAVTPGLVLGGTGLVKFLSTEREDCVLISLRKYLV